MMMKIYHFFINNKTSLISFLMVGAIAAVINFSSFGLFWGFINLNYKIAVSLSFTLSVIFHFTANRHITFKSQHIHLHQQLPKYLSMVGINYVVTLLVMYIVVEDIHLSPYIGNMAAIGMTVGTGYLMSRYWVFV